MRHISIPHPYPQLRSHADMSEGKKMPSPTRFNVMLKSISTCFLDLQSKPYSMDPIGINS